MTSDHPPQSNLEVVRDCAREFRALGAARPRDDDDATLVALDGDSFLARRLGRSATEAEAHLFWSDVESAS